jgi:hypothetical protein
MARGRSRRGRGLPEVRFEAVYGDRRGGTADVHHKVLDARHPDAVRSAIGGRQAWRQRRRATSLATEAATARRPMRRSGAPEAVVTAAGNNQCGRPRRGVTTATG